MLWLIDIIVNQTMICQTTICCLGQRITVAPEGFKSKTKVQSMATVLLYFAKGLMPVVTPREAKPSSTSASVEMISFLKSCRSCPKVHIIYKIHHIASYCIILHHIACWKQTLHLPGCLSQDYSRFIVVGGIPSLGRKPMVGLEPPEETVACAGRLIQANTHLMILIVY